MSYFETKRTVLHVEPHVETIDDFLDENTCTHFIHLAKTRLKQALVTVGNSGVVSKGRTEKIVGYSMTMTRLHYVLRKRHIFMYKCTNTKC